MMVVEDPEYIRNVNEEMLLGIIGQNEMFGKIFSINDGKVSQVETRYKTIVGERHADEQSGSEEVDAPVRGHKQE